MAPIRFQMASILHKQVSVIRSVKFIHWLLNGNLLHYCGELLATTRGLKRISIGLRIFKMSPEQCLSSNRSNCVLTYCWRQHWIQLLPESWCSDASLLLRVATDCNQICAQSTTTSRQRSSSLILELQPQSERSNPPTDMCSTPRDQQSPSATTDGQNPSTDRTKSLCSSWFPISASIMAHLLQIWSDPVSTFLRWALCCSAEPGSSKLPHSI